MTRRIINETSSSLVGPQSAALLSGLGRLLLLITALPLAAEHLLLSYLLLNYLLLSYLLLNYLLNYLLLNYLLRCEIRLSCFSRHPYNVPRWPVLRSIYRYFINRIADNQSPALGVGLGCEGLGWFGPYTRVLRFQISPAMIHLVLAILFFSPSSLALLLPASTPFRVLLESTRACVLRYPGRLSSSKLEVPEAVGSDYSSNI